jgi:dTDP-4-dehydrorhamnose reductase
MPPVKVLILGVTGMLGHTLFSELANHHDYDVYASARNQLNRSCWCPPEHFQKIYKKVNAEDLESIVICLTELQPQVVINCIGIIKQLPSAQDALKSIMVNALYPHRLALVCKAIGARLIHISTDCVFSGTKGGYTEEDTSDAIDLYGRTKFLGEVSAPNCLTIRTSIIGHELSGKNGLVEWFLAQKEKVPGFTKAIYSGLTTLELSRVLKNYVIPNPDLHGLYQVSTLPISKYELLKLIAQTYDKKIAIEPDDQIRVDRSLNSTHFRKATGYSPPTWQELITGMHQNFITAPHYKNRLVQGVL